MGGGISRHNIFDKIIGLDNLFLAWREFCRGKNKKFDVQEFEFNLEDNIFNLHSQLKNGNHQHSTYVSFYIRDPKLRHIHKAQVKDRILHHAIVKIIEPIFERSFIFDSYANRKGKGLHKAIKRFYQYAWRLSKNNTKTVFALKCDIKKFFDSVNHDILMNIFGRKIIDKQATELIEIIIKSFEATKNKGIPLGNLTSQLFSNIYLDKLDQFLKRKLRIKYCVRYADDFVILSRDEIYLWHLIPKISQFLQDNLRLQLHPDKIMIKKWHQGVDFLGYISFPHYFLLRTKTKRRILKKIKERYQEFKMRLISEKSFNQTSQSYYGVLKHCRGYKIRKIIQIILN